MLCRTLPGRSICPDISKCTSEWLSFPRPSAAAAPRRVIPASRGRVPEVSLHTEVKGQFGLGTGRAMGKALRVFILKMHFSRISRSKRKVLLPALPAPPPPRQLLMWQPPIQNATELERHWFESVWRSHASFCGCGDCIGHLQHLAANLGRPPAPQPPREQHPPAVRALPALPAPPGGSGNRASWPGASGGADGDGDAGDRGGADGGPAELADEDLLDAFELAEE